jgi:hypothetical protein
MVVAFLYLIFKPFECGPFLGGVDVILLKLDLLSTISLTRLFLEDSHHICLGLGNLPDLVFLDLRVGFPLNTLSVFCLRPNASSASILSTTLAL